MLVYCFFLLMKLVNDVQFLSVTYLFLLSAVLAVASAPAPLIVIVLLARIYKSV